jgi:hypothetical protein
MLWKINLFMELFHYLIENHTLIYVNPYLILCWPDSNGFITKPNKGELGKSMEKCSFSESLNIFCISHLCFICIFTGYLETLI